MFSKNVYHAIHHIDCCYRNCVTLDGTADANF